MSQPSQVPLPFPKRKSSWRTTLGGVLSAIGTVMSGVCTVVPFPPGLAVGVGLAAVGQALTGLSARDHVVSATAAGLYRSRDR